MTDNGTYQEIRITLEKALTQKHVWAAAGRLFMTVVAMLFSVLGVLNHGDERWVDILICHLWLVGFWVSQTRAWDA